MSHNTVFFNYFISLWNLQKKDELLLLFFGPKWSIEMLNLGTSPGMSWQLFFYTPKIVGNLWKVMKELHVICMLCCTGNIMITGLSRDVQSESFVSASYRVLCVHTPCHLKWPLFPFQDIFDKHRRTKSYNHYDTPAQRPISLQVMYFFLQQDKYITDWCEPKIMVGNHLLFIHNNWINDNDVDFVSWSTSVSWSCSTSSARELLSI